MLWLCGLSESSAQIYFHDNNALETNHASIGWLGSNENPALLDESPYIGCNILNVSYHQRSGNFYRQFAADKNKIAKLSAAEWIRLSRKMILFGQFCFGSGIYHSPAGTLNEFPYDSPFILTDKKAGNVQISSPDIRLVSSYALSQKLSVGVESSFRIYDGLKQNESKAKMDDRTIGWKIGLGYHVTPYQQIACSIGNNDGQARVIIETHYLRHEPKIEQFFGDSLRLEKQLVGNYHRRDRRQHRMVEMSWQYRNTSGRYLRLKCGYEKVTEFYDELETKIYEYATRFGRWHEELKWVELNSDFATHVRKFRMQVDMLLMSGEMFVYAGMGQAHVETRQQNILQGHMRLTSDDSWRRLLLKLDMDATYLEESYYSFNHDYLWERSPFGLRVSNSIDFRLSDTYSLIAGIGIGRVVTDYHLTLPVCLEQSWSIGLGKNTAGRRFDSIFNIRRMNAPEDNREFHIVSVSINVATSGEK